MAHLARRLAHLGCDTGDLDLVVEARMRHPGQHLPCLEMRIGHDVAHVVDRREGYLAAEMLQQLLLGALAREVRHRRDDQVLVGSPALHADEAWIGRHLGLANEPTEDWEMLVCVRCDGDVTVLRREHPEGAEQGMMVTFRGW